MPSDERRPIEIRRMQVVFDTPSPSRDAEFWRQLLDLEYLHGTDPSADDFADADWLNLSSPDRTRRLAFQQVEALRTTTWPDSEVPQQLHLDLAVGTVDDLNELARRALALGGAELLDRRHDDAEPLVVLADPSGHPFCVFVGPA